MKAIRAAITLIAAFLLGWASLAAAQVAVPPLTGRVVDQTETLTSDQKATLEQTLQAFEARKGSQLAVLMVPTSAPETIEQYALRVAEQWKLGRKKVDDGAILVVAKNDRTVRIEVGYGLEGVLNDATSKRIISEIIVPPLQQGDFYGGISAAVDRMIRVVDGESLPAPQPTSVAGDAGIRQIFPILFVLALVGGGWLRSTLGTLPGAVATGGALAIVAWLLAGAVTVGLIAGGIGFLFTLLGGGMGRHGGWYGGGHYGGFGRGGMGGMGGGGFSGGGGGFGGGGASGRF